MRVPHDQTSRSEMCCPVRCGPTSPDACALPSLPLSPRHRSAASRAALPRRSDSPADTAGSARQPAPNRCPDRKPAPRWSHHHPTPRRLHPLQHPEPRPHPYPLARRSHPARARRPLLPGRRRRGGKAFATWFAEDAVTLNNGRPAVQGRGNIAAQATWDPKDYQLTWVAEGAQMGPSNDMGFTWGTYEGRSKDKNGEAVITTGRYITVWRKQTDGSWKVAMDASANAAPDAGVPAAPCPNPDDTKMTQV